MSIRVAEEGARAVLAVSNLGPTIAPEERRRIFERFEQTADGRQSGAGWGLGLYFCRLAVEALGGTVGVEDSAAWDTSFVVRLPARRSGEGESLRA